MLLVHKLTNRGRYLEALYENISDGLLILDDVGRIVEVNGRVALMTGIGRTELIGAPLESLVAIGEGGAAVIQSQLRRCLSGEPVSFELLFERRGAEPLPVEINAQLVSGLSPGRVQAFARDISARRMMEAEIRRQNDELRLINQELSVGRDIAMNASRLKSQFLANMSHELRTPLNSIIGYTQFVLDDQEHRVTDDQREDLGRVLKSARHLLDLINGVLDVARIESGRESVSISRFALGDLVDSVIDAVTPMAKGKGLSIECRNEVHLRCARIGEAHVDTAIDERADQSLCAVHDGAIRYAPFMTARFRVGRS
jgi:PAS domain S-box-containing protein